MLGTTTGYAALGVVSVIAAVAAAVMFRCRRSTDDKGPRESIEIAGFGSIFNHGRASDASWLEMTSNPVFSTAAAGSSRRASPSLGRDGESPAARDQANPVALSAKERSDRIYDEFVAPNKPKRYRLSRAGRALDARQPSTSEAEARAGANPMHRAAPPTPLTPVVEIPAAVVQPPNGAGLPVVEVAATVHAHPDGAVPRRASANPMHRTT